MVVDVCKARAAKEKAQRFCGNVITDESETTYKETITALQTWITSTENGIVAEESLAQDAAT